MELCRRWNPGELRNFPVSFGHKWRMYSKNPFGLPWPLQGCTWVHQNPSVAAIFRWNGPGATTVNPSWFFAELLMVHILRSLSILSFVAKSLWTRTISSSSYSSGTLACSKRFMKTCQLPSFYPSSALMALARYWMIFVTESRSTGSGKLSSGLYISKDWSCCNRMARKCHANTLWRESRPLTSGSHGGRMSRVCGA